MANISLTLYTNGFIGSFLKSPTQMGSLSINNSSGISHAWAPLMQQVYIPVQIFSATQLNNIHYCSQKTFFDAAKSTYQESLYALLGCGFCSCTNCALYRIILCSNVQRHLYVRSVEKCFPVPLTSGNKFLEI
jgi:hypothetical protein